MITIKEIKGNLEEALRAALKIAEDYGDEFASFLADKSYSSARMAKPFPRHPSDDFYNEFGEKYGRFIVNGLVNYGIASKEGDLFEFGDKAAFLYILELCSVKYIVEKYIKRFVVKLLLMTSHVQNSSSKGLSICYLSD